MPCVCFSHTLHSSTTSRGKKTWSTWHGDLLRQLIAENGRALSGRDIRYLVPLRPEPEPEPDRKKRPDILLTGTGTGYPVHPYSVMITVKCRRSVWEMDLQLAASADRTTADRQQVLVPRDSLSKAPPALLQPTDVAIFPNSRRRKAAITEYTSLLVQTCFICNTIPQHLCPTCQTNASRPARRARPVVVTWSVCW